MTIKQCISYCNKFVERIIYSSICIVCKKFYYLIGYYPRIIAVAGACSKKCGSVLTGRANETGKYIPCAICNKQKWITQYRIKRSKRFFCSRKCHGIGVSGELSTTWNGGKMKSGGYIYTSIHNHNSRKYVGEHRIVMEKYLGRKLKPFENIHHINGIRNDNRIENLELWTTSQPYGQRVDDIIKFVCVNYAKEVEKFLHK